MSSKPELFKDPILEEARIYLRRSVFQPWKFQKSIDINAAGGLNYESCNSIRRDVEELEKRSFGVIPHGSTIAKSGKILEKHAIAKYGLNVIVDNTPHGPSLRFDLDTVLRLILKGFGLDKFAATDSGHPPVMLAHTLDGAMLASHLGHVTAGIKIVDPRAIDPMTGYAIGIDGLFQTRELCFALQIVFGKDCKDLYETHALLTSLPSSMVGYSFQPQFKTQWSYRTSRLFHPRTCPSIWKTTGLGGGSFNKKQFCYACMCENNQISLFSTGEKRCERCARLGIERCFCHPVNDQIHLSETAKLLENHVKDALDVGFSKLDYVLKKTKIKTNESLVNKEIIKDHIDFVPKVGQ